MVRICAHYFAHGAWLEEGALLRDAGRLAGIPGVLIHGRLDLSGPLDTAWELARAWPDAKLVALRDSGHQGSDTKRDRCSARSTSSPGNELASDFRDLASTVPTSAIERDPLVGDG